MVNVFLVVYQKSNFSRNIKIVFDAESLSFLGLETWTIIMCNPPFF